MKLTESLRRADFVLSRGGISRTDADRTPLAVTGSLSVSDEAVSVTWSVGADTITDTLTNRVDSGPKAILAHDVTSTPANDAPSAATKANFFSL